MDKKILKVEQMDISTGEIETLTVQPVTVVKEKRYRFEGDGSPQPKGDAEFNDGEYIVDETGYVDLKTLFERSLRQGTFDPFASYDGEFDIDDDTDIDGLDEPVSEPEAPEPLHSEGASSSEVSGSQQNATDKTEQAAT